MDKANTIQKVVTQALGAHQSYWVGYKASMTQPDRFEWTDGSPDIFQNWEIGQPNTIGNRQCAAAESTGQWSTRECTVSLPFICQAAVF